MKEKKNTDIYEHLHAFIQMSKAETISEDELQLAVMNLFKVIEPYCA